MYLCNVIVLVGATAGAAAADIVVVVVDVVVSLCRAIAFTIGRHTSVIYKFSLFFFLPLHARTHTYTCIYVYTHTCKHTSMHLLNMLRIYEYMHFYLPNPNRYDKTQCT